MTGLRKKRVSLKKERFKHCFNFVKDDTTKMNDFDTAKKRCQEIRQKVVDEVGEIKCLDSFILMFLMFDNATYVARDKEMMADFSDDVKRA